MCILFISTAHPDYRLIALSNRDEVFSRPTASVSWHGDVLCPEDLAKAEHGTWIAISKRARISVLLNVSEVPTGKEDVSRGIFASKYVTSEQKDIESWFDQLHGSADHSGGFNLVCGELDSDSKGDLNIVTNRGEQHLKKLSKGSYCISNAILGIEWPKTTNGAQVFGEMIANTHDEQGIIEAGFDILSTSAFSENEIQNPNLLMLRKSIFIPKVPLEGDIYGTRTQTIILVDKNGRARYIEKNVVTGETKEEVFSL